VAYPRVLSLWKRPLTRFLAALEIDLSPLAGRGKRCRAVPYTTVDQGEVTRLPFVGNFVTSVRTSAIQERKQGG